MLKGFNFILQFPKSVFECTAHNNTICDHPICAINTGITDDHGCDPYIWASNLGLSNGSFILSLVHLLHILSI